MPGFLRAPVPTWKHALLALSFAAITASAGTPDLERVTNDLSDAVAVSRRLAVRLAPYDVAFRRDPLRPLVDEQGTLISASGLSGGLSVQGILYSPSRPLALVDDELFGIGQTVGPYTITAIQPDGVTVQRSGAPATQVIPLDRGTLTPAAP